MVGSIFKIIPHVDADSNKLYERLNYIRNPIATNVCMTYGSFVSCRKPWDEMMFVKHSYLSPYNNTLQGKHFFEIVISLTQEESGRVQDFVLCVQDINRFLATYNDGHFQTISAVHTNTDNLHAHIICNNIDFMTGARFSPPPHVTYEMKVGVSAWLFRHGFSGVLGVTAAA